MTERASNPTLPSASSAAPGDPDGSGDFIASGALRLLGGRYEIMGLLGMGGMGAVYRARDLELGDTVALKVLRADFANGAEAHARFRREVRLARRVTHKNVARTYDLGDADGHRYLTMELVDGLSLSELLEWKGPLSFERTLEIGISIADGVAAAHEAGVIHRDLKPDNIVIAEDGRVVVMDFGVARGLEERSELGRFVIGTPAYMAPEQAENAVDLDGRADQYAIGVMLYEALSGKLPFPGPTLSSLAQRLTQPPPNLLLLRPNVGTQIANIVQRCMARDRNERFSSVADLANELRALRDRSSPILSRAPSTMPPRPTREPVRLAILPLDAEGAKGHEHIGPGFSDALIDALSVVPGLLVCARGVTSRITGSSGEVRERARLLGAQLLLTGAVVTRDDGLHVKLHLATVEDGFLIWRTRLRGAAADLARFTDEAVTGVAQALGLVVPEIEKTLSNPEALDLYMRGRREYFRFSPAANARACELLRLATERAPDDPVVLSAYAMAAARQLGVEIEYAGPLEMARSAALRAHQVAPNRAESQVALGTVALHAGDAPTAADHAARALRSSPSSAEALYLSGRLLLEAGAVTEGAANADMALALEPRYGGLKYAAARAMALAGDWTESERVLLRAPPDRVSPFSYWLDRLRMCYWQNDPLFIAGVATENIAGLEPIEQRIAREVAMTIRERRMIPELVQTFNELTYKLGATNRTKCTYAQLTAEARAYIGMEDEAASALLRAVDEGLYDFPWLSKCRVLDRLRARPDIQAIFPIVETRARTVRLTLGASP